ncbi:MAG: ribonuclease T2-like [Cirrosporium novae-zelandiae]|nr:MAG: ribonuclease T2-like [Cirrosporium novae-zelandiae]
MSGGDEYFWDHEFSKHATCINTLNPSCYPDYKPQEEVVDFFNRTVDLFQTLDTYQFLAAAGIYPSLTKTYNSTAIQAALQTARGVNTNFRCSNGKLNEMWFAFDVSGSIQTGQFIPAEPVGMSSNCPSTGIKYLPKNTTTDSTMSSQVLTSADTPVSSA